MSSKSPLLRAFLATAPLVVGGVAHSQAAPRYTTGQAIEVREGDVWSKAAVVKAEAGRYLIRYDGAADVEEWLATERMRVPQRVPAAAQPKPPPGWVVGARVQVKWVGNYREARVVGRRDEWHLIEYAGFNGGREWVEPWRIRRIGSNEDPIGIVSPNPHVAGDEGPPREKPGPRPELAGPGVGDPSNPSLPASMRKAPNDAFTKDPAYRKVDVAGMQLLDFRAAASTPAPAFVPDAAVPMPAIRKRGGITLRGMTHETFDMPSHFAFPRARPTQLFIAHSGSQAYGSEVRLERVDLAAGRSAIVHDIDPGLELLDVSPDGSQALFQSAVDALAGLHLVVYKLDPNPDVPARRTLVFTPYVGEFFDKVKSAAFVDNDHIVTSGSDRIVLWRLSTTKAVWACKGLTSTQAPALSANGKQLALPLPAGIRVVESLSGKALVEVDGKGVGFTYLAFSPSGKRLAARTGYGVVAWDLPTGRRVAEIPGARNVPIQPIEMASDDHALTSHTLGGGLLLFDLGRNLLLWKYSPSSIGAHGQTAPDGRYVYAMREPFRKSARLFSAELPQPAVIDAAGKINFAEDMLLTAGTRVGLTVTAPPETDPAGLTAALKKRLADAGFVVDDAAPLKFVATIELGHAEHRQYRPHGRPPAAPLERINVTPMVSTLALQAPDGTVAWKASTLGAGDGMIYLKVGQKIEDAVKEASRPDPKFFSTIFIPKSIPKPGDVTPYGSSYLTSKGVTPYPQ